MSTKINQYLNEKKNPKTSQHILSEIMLQYTYPRYVISDLFLIITENVLNEEN